MGESSFWYRPTRVVPDQRPLNGRQVVQGVILFQGGDIIFSPGGFLPEIVAGGELTSGENPPGGDL